MNDLNPKRKGMTLMAIVSIASALAQPALASRPKTGDAGKLATIVLVHGAFADGSSWESVIPILQKAGYEAIAVQEPLTSFAADVEAVKRVIDAQDGNVIAVGHSYGGAVISAAAAGNPRVKSIVFVTAFAPEQGEKIGDLYGKFGKPALLDALRPDSAGFLYIDAPRYRGLFAGDVPELRTKVMAATQKPIAKTAFEGSIPSAPAWKTISSWFLITAQDRAMPPELQRFMAKRIGAKTVELEASHVPFVSRPHDVAKFILEAAKAAD